MLKWKCGGKFMNAKRHVSLTMVALTPVAVFALTLALALCTGTDGTAEAAQGDLRVFFYVDNTELSQQYNQVYGYTLDFTTNRGQTNGSSYNGVLTTLTWMDGTYTSVDTNGAKTNTGTLASFSGKPQPSGMWHIGGLRQAGQITLTAKKGNDTYKQTFTYNYTANECFAVFFTSADKTVTRTPLSVSAPYNPVITYDGQQHDAKPWADDLTWTADDISVKSNGNELPKSDYTVSTADNGNGVYTVTIKLKDLGDIRAPQIVYIDGNGGVEAFKTDYVYDADGKAGE